MRIEVNIDQSHSEPLVRILTPEMTDEVSELVRHVSELAAVGTPQITGYQDDVVSLIDIRRIIRVYSANQKVFAEAEGGTFRLRLRLYEVEERLQSAQFVRISKSEIINLAKVRGFDLSFAGTICVEFKNGSKTYVSRRYVAKIKQVLGV